MAGKSNTFENDFLKLIFNGTTIDNIANNATSSPLTNLYVSLHTGNIDESGNQTTNECTYTGYGRVAVPRSSAGWTITNNIVTPTANIMFNTCGGGSNIVTHWAVGTAETSTGKVLYFGEVEPDINVTIGVIPFILTTSTITED